MAGGDEPPARRSKGLASSCSNLVEESGTRWKISVLTGVSYASGISYTSRGGTELTRNKKKSAGDIAGEVVPGKKKSAGDIG